MAHQKGRTDEARAAYEELYKNGYVSAAYMLPLGVLLLREGGEENYLRVRWFLAKAEEAPDLDPSRRQELLMDYAVAQYKLGELEKAVQLLEASHRKGPCGLTYQSLGFLYIEAGDKEKALSYNQEALDYDDEDPVVLDNLGQTYYRLLDDKETARQYFEKAHEIKDSQIDTLYFLAQYDLEEGKKQDALEKLEQAMEGRFSPLNFASREKVQQLIDELKKA